MNNLQYSSGERNHYFYGKLMTVRDFQDEQTYKIGRASCRERV